MVAVAAKETAPRVTKEIEEAYMICRATARREAKNFYYAFIVLPARKRDAICAVYAFLRRADDLSDDESRSLEERRGDLNRWREDWHRTQSGGATEDPVFLAMLDVQQRFQIPSSLLDQLVEGTASDLQAPALEMGDGGSESGAGRFTTYPDFPSLYRYCYLVASVVGLICIRIFGYRDPRAETLAEQTGIAFQLTNILRDVKEDALRGRLYLPLEDLERCGLRAREMIEMARRGQTSDEQRRVLYMEAERAREFYRSARLLLPLIDADSRPSLWVLVTIYQRLLRRIEQRNFEVVAEKIKVPVYEKAAILGWGLCMSLFRGLQPK